MSKFDFKIFYELVKANTIDGVICPERIFDYILKCGPSGDVRHSTPYWLVVGYDKTTKNLRVYTQNGLAIDFDQTYVILANLSQLEYNLIEGFYIHTRCLHDRF